MTREDELKLKRITEKFNSMPFEYRHIASDSETQVRIMDLERLKIRLKANYERELKFINDAIKSYLKSIKP